MVGGTDHLPSHPEPSATGLRDNCFFLKITCRVAVLLRDLKVRSLKMSSSFTQICVGARRDVGYLKKGGKWHS